MSVQLGGDPIICKDEQYKRAEVIERRLKRRVAMNRAIKKACEKARNSLSTRD